jgi:hypothetical protein
MGVHSRTVALENRVESNRKCEKDVAKLPNSEDHMKKDDKG